MADKITIVYFKETLIYSFFVIPEVLIGNPASFVAQTNA